MLNCKSSRSDLSLDAHSEAPLSRRRFLYCQLAALPALVLVAKHARAEACVDPDEQDSLRESLNYQEAADDPKRACKQCAFFTAGEGSCGDCQIFHGPANERGTCDSWASRS